MGMAVLRRGPTFLMLSICVALTPCVCASATRSPNSTLSDLTYLSRPIVNTKAFSGHGELAFVSGSELYVLDGATRKLRHVLTGSPPPSRPSFSHDGRWLAFLRFSPKSNNYDETLWIARGDGADPHQVAHVPPAYAVPDSGEPVYSWSPTEDELLVTTGPVTDAPLVPREVWVVRAAGGAHRLLGPGYTNGASWSPNGRQVAVIWGGNGPADQVVETLPPSGGTPTVWLADGDNTFYLGGWAPRFGVLVWDDEGNGGPSVENYGLPLDAIAQPGSTLVQLATAPLFQPPAFSIGPKGELAVVAIGPEKTASDPDGEKFVWFDKAVETCSPLPVSCTAVSGQPSSVSLNPSISPADGSLAFVEAPQSSQGIVPAYSALQTWTQIAGWYAEHSLWMLSPGSTTPTEISDTSGAIDPVWSSRGTGIVFEKNQGLWLLTGVGAKPMEVVSPLDFPATSSSGSYLFGYVDWTGQFAWSG
jgi:hypothetical protein